MSSAGVMYHCDLFKQGSLLSSKNSSHLSSAPTTFSLCVSVTKDDFQNPWRILGRQRRREISKQPPSAPSWFYRSKSDAGSSSRVAEERIMDRYEEWKDKDGVIHLASPSTANNRIKRAPRSAMNSFKEVPVSTATYLPSEVGSGTSSKNGIVGMTLDDINKTVHREESSSETKSSTRSRVSSGTQKSVLTEKPDENNDSDRLFYLQYDKPLVGDRFNKQLRQLFPVVPIKRSLTFQSELDQHIEHKSKCRVDNLHRCLTRPQGYTTHGSIKSTTSTKNVIHGRNNGLKQASMNTRSSVRSKMYQQTSSLDEFMQQRDRTYGLQKEAKAILK